MIVFTFLWSGFDVRAQATEKIPESDQWQLTLDVIKSKAHRLVKENYALQVEYGKLMERVQELQQSINGQQNKNEQLSRFLKERHGYTEQQLRIKELTEVIKTKRQQLEVNASPTVGDQLTRLHIQLEDESKQEVLLENELRALKTGGKT
jgi:regulator of replication initiation timing